MWSVSVLSWQALIGFWLGVGFLLPKAPVLVPDIILRLFLEHTLPLVRCEQMLNLELGRRRVQPQRQSVFGVRGSAPVKIDVFLGCLHKLFLLLRRTTALVLWRIQASLLLFGGWVMSLDSVLGCFLTQVFCAGRFNWQSRLVRHAAGKFS